MIRSKAAALARADVYEKYVAMYMRLFGWDVVQQVRPEGGDDPGDLLCTRNGAQMVVDVKENGNWTRQLDRKRPWFPFPTINLTSVDQFHPDWVYCVVATDLHALAMITPNKVPVKGWGCDTHHHDEYGYDYKIVQVAREFAEPRLLHLSGRPA